MRLQPRSSRDNLRGRKGKDALAYLQTRGVTEQAVSRISFGACGSGRPATGTATAEVRSGADGRFGTGVAQRENSGFYDNFRGRLMFPIHNEAGKVIAFGGRAMRPEEQAKYVNSPDTPIYKKSSVLYNLHRAKIDARKNDRMILVEGYMDVIGVYSAGIKEVVASSGTAVSVDQVRTIKTASRAAAGKPRADDSELRPGRSGRTINGKVHWSDAGRRLRVRVLPIPGGLDPDEYIQQHGPEAYGKLLETATSYFHWLADRAREKFDMRSPEGRVDAFEYLLPVLQLVHDRVERGAIANDLAEYMNVDRDTIRENLRPEVK